MELLWFFILLILEVIGFIYLPYITGRLLLYMIKFNKPDDSDKLIEWIIGLVTLAVILVLCLVTYKIIW